MKAEGKRPKTAPELPFGYRTGNSLLHRCPAPVKILAVLLLSVFAYGSIPALAAAILAITLGALIAGIRPWELLRGSRPVLILALLFLFLRIIKPDPGAAPFFRVDTGGITGGLTQGLSMLASFAGGALLFAVTTMKELRDSLGGRDRRGSKGVRHQARGPFPLFRFGLAFSLMLGFLPRFFEIWEETGMALDARCARRGIRRFLLIIPPVTERMIEKALDTALALESRGVEP